MDAHSDIKRHYAAESPIRRIRSQLVKAGLDLDALEPHDLSGVDEFHLGGKLATNELLKSMDLSHDSLVLDVGSGIGGAARSIATATGATVQGIDLTPAFVDTARHLSELVGLADQTRFDLADATALPFDDIHFDAATLLHVGMNIDDKSALFAELARVVRPGGRVHVYDIMRTGEGELNYPLPWSSVPSSSSVATPDEYLKALEGAGLDAGAPQNRTGLVMTALKAAQTSPPAVNLSHLMGANWPTMFGNLRNAMERELLAPVEITAVRR